ncbi:MAG: response regulator [Pseudomonadota bacterium]
MKILIVDDMIPVRKPLELHLTHEGHQVVSLNNGFEALEALGRENYDLVISDIRMPIMDGLQLLRWTRSNFPDLDVILVTGFGDLNSSLEALRYGATDYLMKPINLEELSHAVGAVEKRLTLMALLKEKEEKLEQARKMADLGLVVAGVAHEINNPNTFIRGNIQTIKKFWDHLGPFIQKALDSGIESPVKADFFIKEMPKIFESTLDGTDRIKKIVDSLTTFTGLGRNLNLEAVDLNACVLEVLKDCGGRVQEFGAETDLQPNLPPVRAFKERLKEIILELLTNSARAVAAVANPKVIIASRGVFPHRVALEVRDNGRGIKEVDKKKIFTPFFSTEPCIGRPGLGLSKVYSLVTSFGGEVFYDSREGAGAKFVVQLEAFQEKKPT